MWAPVHRCARQLGAVRAEAEPELLVPHRRDELVGHDGRVRSVLFTTGAATLPTPWQASPVGSTSATLNGTVSPGGLKTSYYFEYGTSATSLGSKTPTADAGSGSTDVPVSSALSGLSPASSYWFRIVATNSSGTTDGALGLFTTGVATLATTGQASPVGSTSATLNGTVSPGR